METHCVWVSTSPKSSRACRTPRLTQTHQTFYLYCANKAARAMQTGHLLNQSMRKTECSRISCCPQQGMLVKFLRSFNWSRVFGLYRSCRRRVVFLFGAESGVRIRFPAHDRFGMTPVYPRTDVGFRDFATRCSSPSVKRYARHGFVFAWLGFRLHRTNIEQI